MYLLVFVTIVISLIGIYTQILTLQTARLAAGQTTLAQAMLAWHATAVSEARYGVYTTLGPYTPNASGCSLTDNLTPVTDGICQGNNGAIISIAIVTRNNNHFPGLPDCTAVANAPPCWTGLPPGYQGDGFIGPYTFYSLYYSPGAGQRYVITFVPPPNPAAGVITLPGSLLPSTAGQFAPPQIIGVTMAELLHQLHNANMPIFNYGMTKAQTLTTVPISDNSNGTGAASLSFSLPTDGCPAKCIVPNGSVAIISVP